MSAAQAGGDSEAHGLAHLDVNVARLAIDDLCVAWLAQVHAHLHSDERGGNEPGSIRKQSGVRPLLAQVQPHLRKTGRGWTHECLQQLPFHSNARMLATRRLRERASSRHSGLQKGSSWPLPRRLWAAGCRLATAASRTTNGNNSQPARLAEGDTRVLLSQLLGCGVQQVIAQRHQHHVQALPCQLACDRLADAWW